MLAVAAITAFAPRRASADARSAVSFEVVRQHGADDCPDATELRKSVIAQLGYDPFRDDAADRVVVVFSAVRGGLKSSIVRAGAAGSPARRELSSRAARCDELANSTRLAIAIAIDPQSYLRPPPPVEPALPSPPPPIEPAPRPSPPPAKATVERAPWSAPAPAVPRSESRLAFWLGAGGLSAVGAAPLATGGFVVHGSVRPRGRGNGFSFGLEGRFDWPRTYHYGIGSFDSNFILGSLVPCAHAGIAAACLIGSLGALRAKSQGYEHATSQTGFMALAGARGAIAWPLGAKVALVLFVDVQVNPGRATLTIDERPVWRTPALTGDLGLQVRFAP